MPQPEHTLTTAQCRAFDRYAIDVLGIPGIVLMENAGRNATAIICDLLPPGRTGRVSILCGKGNNGGDGFVIARHLTIRGIGVDIALAADPALLTGDAATNHGIVARMGIPVQPLHDAEQLTAGVERWRTSALLVDALLGTGFAGEVRGFLAEVIEAVNALQAPPVVAVDVPSGLNADTGLPGGTAIRADHTITFIAPKTGYAAPKARSFVGQLHVADIGAPRDLILAELERS